MHLVAFNKVVFLFVNSGRGSGIILNVVIQIPAQIFIKDSGQEVEFFIIVFLCKKRNKGKQEEKKLFNALFKYTMTKLGARSLGRPL